jgi:hypothetical protein
LITVLLPASGSQNQIADFANGAKATSGMSCMVAALTHRIDCVGHSDRKTCMFEQRQIRHIIADIRAFGSRDSEPVRQFVERRNFVFATLNNVFDTELGHAQVNGSGLPAADHGDCDAGIDQAANTVPVLGMERLGFKAIVGQIEPAIGKHAVDIERDKTDSLQDPN